MPLAVLDAAQMGATRKIPKGSGGLGMWIWILPIPVGTILESQRVRGIPENKIVVLKDAAQRGRIDDLDGFAVVFFAFIEVFQGRGGVF